MTALTCRERSQPASVALLLAAPALCLLAASLLLAFERWRWESICVRICGPFLPVELPYRDIDAFRRAMDWHTPLAVAAAAALVLVALWAGARVGRASR
jgi:hypothetical protein